MRFNNCPAYSQPETGTLFASCEVWLEDRIRVGTTDSNSVVGDRDGYDSVFVGSVHQDGRRTFGFGLCCVASIHQQI